MPARAAAACPDQPGQCPDRCHPGREMIRIDGDMVAEGLRVVRKPPKAREAGSGANERAISHPGVPRPCGPERTGRRQHYPGVDVAKLIEVDAEGGHRPGL